MPLRFSACILAALFVIACAEPPNKEMDQLLADIKQHGTILDATLNVYDSDPRPRSCPGNISPPRRSSLRVSRPMRCYRIVTRGT